ncbi:MAG: hypothetical protein KC933_35020, partial [Myxococcales bacterium]|nr:hypothetical protein [Myxococcales bacterium]
AAAAERFYRLAAEHPGGAGFREEALLQRAAQLEALGRAEEAMTALRRAASAFPDGGLAPERAALMATLGLKLGRLDEARDALLAVADRSDRVLDGPRVAVAEALLASEPRRAQALLQHVVSRPGPAQAAARALSARAEELF